MYDFLKDKKHKKKRIVLKAGTKSGKTRAFINFIVKMRGASFLSLTPRVSLASDQFEEFSKHGISCKYYKNMETLSLRSGEFMICEVESIHHKLCRIQDFSNYIVFIDEINSFVNHIMTSSTLKSVKQFVFYKLDQIFKTAKMIYWAMRSRLPLLEQAHEVGEGVTEEEVLDGVYTLGRANNRMRERDHLLYCYERVKEGFMRLLGEDSAKRVAVTKNLLNQTTRCDGRIAEFRALWERMKVSLPDEAVSNDVANQLGDKLRKKGQFEETKVLWLAALEGRRRVLGAEDKDTLASLNNMGNVLKEMEDYEGALGYYHQALRVKEKVLGKTHPATLATMHNMASTYQVGLKDFTKVEEMYRLALDGKEKSLGKDHEGTKMCARNLAILSFQGAPSKENLRWLITKYPHLLQGPEGGELFRSFLQIRDIAYNHKYFVFTSYIYL